VESRNAKSQPHLQLHRRQAGVSRSDLGRMVSFAALVQLHLCHQSGERRCDRAKR
jgi:hypothetical protein